MFISGNILLQYKSPLQITLLAGESGLDESISWIFTTDTLQFDGHIFGGELVILHNYNFTPVKDDLLSIIKHICSLNASSLLLYNCSGYELSSHEINYADTMHFPIYRIQNDTKAISLSVFAANLAKFMFTYQQKQLPLSKHLQEIILKQVSTATLSCYSFSQYLLYNEELHNYIVTLYVPYDFSRCSSYLQLFLSEQLYSYINARVYCFLNNKCVILTGNSYESPSQSIERIKQCCDNLLTKLRSQSEFKNMKIGIGHSIHSVSQIYASYVNSIHALKLLFVESTDASVVTYTSIPASYKCILSMSSLGSTKALWRQRLHRLLEYDRNNDTNLIEIAELYLNNDCHLAITAEKLYLHRNTLAYRLNKIEELTHLSFKSLNDCCDLKITLFAYKLYVFDKNKKVF